jgi:hypothetical protein
MIYACGTFVSSRILLLLGVLMLWDAAEELENDNLIIKQRHHDKA